MSVDSVYSHANWAEGLGGISFPLLADFHPKGAVANSYGLYLADKGITDRATVVVDAGGVVRHSSSVTPAGSRDIAELASICEGVDRDYSGELRKPPPPAGVKEATLFVKNNCGFSTAALLARANLHLSERVAVRNVSDDAGALAELEKATGKQQAPALVIGGDVLLESADIVKRLVADTTGLTG